MPDHVLSALPSAEIIPFPARPRAQPARTAPPADTARLEQALAALDAALQAQRAAVAGWRDSIAALRDSTTGLGASLARYSATLESLESDVRGFNTQAHALERWADDVLTRASPAG